MHFLTLSTPGSASKANEDLIFTLTHGDAVCDLLMFDGASSVSERHYLDTALGDPAWFVQQFAAVLKNICKPELKQADSMQMALETLREQHHALLAAAAMPVYAWPIAAMTWLRLRDEGETISAAIYALGDCKLFLREANGTVTNLDPYQNPQEEVLKVTIAALKQGGFDEQARWEHLLPMLRERRVAQNMSAQPSILCLYPQGPQGRFSAREYNISINKTARLLAMTDGFSRLADTYYLYSEQDLMQACITKGLDALMQELRDHEAATTGGSASVKKADDASVALVSF